MLTLVTSLSCNKNSLNKNEPAINKSLSSLIDRWLTFANVSDNSIIAYHSAIKQFLSWLNDHNICNPSFESILLWRDSLKSKGLAPSTINLYLSSCRLFFSFLDVNNFFHLNLSHLKGSKINHLHKKDALTVEQAKSVLNSFDDSFKGLRDKSMVALMLCCGLRTIELVRADRNDFQLSFGRSTLFVQGKGRLDKSDCVMIPVQVEQLINRYLAMRKDNSNVLFINNRGERLTTRSIRRIVKQSFEKVGINSDRITTHSLRHSAATHMLLNGIPLDKVQQVLRHRNINTTMIYSHHLDRLKNHAEDSVANSFF